MSEDKKTQKSALQVNPGIEAPPIVNPYAMENLRKKRRKLLSVDEYCDGILSGNRTILSQAITLIESSLPEHNVLSRDIIERCLPYSGKSIRIGITGVPGVGKSTFIEALGNEITRQNHTLAVLAIDPSSERSKGSILGDKTRMETLSVNDKAFIRPSPSAGSLGGVARKTRETIILVEAAGFDTIFVETVGVGQSETAVHSMVDFFLLLMLAGAGDELQGIKRGIMEMADALVINKADGENINKAMMAKTQYNSALQLFPPSPSGWKPRAMTASALQTTGIKELWETISEYISKVNGNNYFDTKRKEQSKFWMHETINESLRNAFYQNQDTANNIKVLEQKLLDNKISPFAAARQLLNEHNTRTNS
ncbi:MAG: methylmalonyl Co-A mutase-associated GTPase MeaB [Salinivirgaceae bacterium]|nr:methylmalonyl Co-A mutase-associated GTPase MeaB [Salinivirgaceae bacterium]MDD4747182.1 methylmalonyl Co-A mutase-associated GTPase MeaB [Salinivirgaceae bacterium]MDY0281806.1 methylmalonyl Co-A mutase-associated GTPase MeaB [Salinivirgaceae bacterium]